MTTLLNGTEAKVAELPKTADGHLDYTKVFQLSGWTDELHNTLWTSKHVTWKHVIYLCFFGCIEANQNSILETNLNFASKAYHEIWPKNVLQLLTRASHFHFERVQPALSLFSSPHRSFDTFPALHIKLFGPKSRKRKHFKKTSKRLDFWRKHRWPEIHILH